MSLYLILCRDIFVCRYTISIHLSILFILSVHRIRVCSWGLEKLLNCSLYQLFRTSFYYHLYFCAQIHSCCSSFGCICDIIIVAVTSSEVSNGHFAAIIYHEWIWSLHFIGTNLWNKRVSKRNGHSLPGKWIKSPASRSNRRFLQKINEPKVAKQWFVSYICQVAPNYYHWPKFCYNETKIKRMNPISNLLPVCGKVWVIDCFHKTYFVWSIYDENMFVKY